MPPPQSFLSFRAWLKWYLFYEIFLISYLPEILASFYGFPDYQKEPSTSWCFLVPPLDLPLSAFIRVVWCVWLTFSLDYQQGSIQFHIYISKVLGTLSPVPSKYLMGGCWVNLGMENFLKCKNRCPMPSLVFWFQIINYFEVSVKIRKFYSKNIPPYTERGIHIKCRVYSFLHSDENSVSSAHSFVQPTSF